MRLYILTRCVCKFKNKRFVCNQITREEVESRLRVLVALGDKEVERHVLENEELPSSVQHQLQQLGRLQQSLTAVIENKEVCGAHNNLNLEKLSYKTIENFHFFENTSNIKAVFADLTYLGSSMNLTIVEYE